MHLLNNSLSEESNSNNENIACKKSINGNKKSNELILIFEVNELATEVHDSLMQWLFKCLDKISDKVFNGQYNWNIVSQIKDNDFEDEERNCIVNSLMVAIHITFNGRYTSQASDDLTLPYNPSEPYMTLSPQDIMNCLIQEPVFIKNIGVSAVSSKVMKYWWGQIISRVPYLFDVTGEGNNIHPMWIKYTDGYWRDIREQSDGFWCH
uniref:Uncharacterized protein n=1 Tax=Megaviridae environmental sample TaxID=1737588 RepID=A0A5J6VLP5_9VIRU|nr:MAG: hypothetical protein [Megaviridae environmental sample]